MNIVIWEMLQWLRIGTSAYVHNNTQENHGNTYSLTKNVTFNNCANIKKEKNI